jgi:hypothetical protein
VKDNPRFFQAFVASQNTSHNMKRMIENAYSQRNAKKNYRGSSSFLHLACD